MNKKTPDRILKLEAIICKASGVEKQSLYSSTRKKEVASARHAIWFIAHDLLGFNLSLVARVYGRDHTTVRHGVLKMRKSDVIKHVIARVRTVAPELFTRRGDDEMSPIESWDFERVPRVT